jgi:hypothetical protein
MIKYKVVGHLTHTVSYESSLPSASEATAVLMGETTHSVLEVCIYKKPSKRLTFSDS